MASIPPGLVSRRTMLKAASVVVALPFLETLVPRLGSAAERAAERAAQATVPRRLVAIETNMGILPQFFFPEKAGTDYVATPYLERLAAHRKHLTVFSGVSLPGVGGAHKAERCFLTGTPYPDRAGFRNGVSLDQIAAEQVGGATRFSSLALSVNGEGSPTLSFTRSGAPIPAINSAKKLFRLLFSQARPEDEAANVEALRQGRSMLDFVGDDARRLNRELSQADRQRMEQYFASVRELELRMQNSEAWEHKPKPVVTAQEPTDIDDPREFSAQSRLMFDVIKLALETDSTRVVSLFIDATQIHGLTHHGNRPEVIAELRAKEEQQFDVLGGFLKSLSGIQEQGQSVLDRTMVLYGTPMGSGNSHDNNNLPVLLAGGGFKHGQHLAFDTKNNYPLTNLYVSMLQRFGVETDAFSTSKGTMTGLEMM